MLNRTKTAYFVFLLVLTISLASAHGDSLEEAKKLVASNVTCDTLDDEQLEAIGEYYMEQMHPAESHELMDKMMGGEGSETLKQMHINMAKSLYCNENVGGMMGGDMMNMMMGNNMMSSCGMMGNMMGGQNMQGSMMGYGALGYTWNLFSILYLVLLIGLIVLVWLGVIKLWRTLRK